MGSPKQLGFVWKQLWLDVWFSWKPHDREVMRETAGPALCAISPHSFATTLLKFPSPTFITGPPGTPALTVREADALSPTTSASYLSRNVCFQLHVNNFLTPNNVIAMLLFKKKKKIYKCFTIKWTGVSGPARVSLEKKKEMGGEIGGLKDGDVQGGWGVAFM